METGVDLAGPEGRAGREGRMKYFTSSDGLKLAYFDEGSGMPMVCLPGLSRNSEDFEPVAAAFSDRARIIRLDLRGRGESEYDKNFSNYNVMVEARDVVELLDHLGLDRAVVFGTSRGGLIALALAGTERGRLSGIIFNDIGPHIDPTGMARIVRTLGILPPEETLEPYIRRFAAESAEQFPGVTYEHWRTYVSRTLQETPDGLEYRYDTKIRDAVLASLEAGNWPDLWPLLDQCEGLPLLLLKGENSDILSYETAEEMHRRRPDMDYVIVKDRGHIPFLDEPEAQAAIGKYIEALKN
ncbi:alpha/beta fold hydrolase [Amaricoccus macauensis]|uniref:alpha/beta fold hydrolase n=1 Tax=Amaricoccus macauensis TaxID=57001 RepID=UPI003C7D4554